jgi:polysaccharide export outer membrane protein
LQFPAEQRSYRITVPQCSKDPQKNKLGFGLVQISSDLLTILANDTPTPLSSLDRVTDRPTNNDMIGPGDTIQISIYELGNGLFGGGGSNASGTSMAAALAGGRPAARRPAASCRPAVRAHRTRASSAKAMLSNLPPLKVSATGTVTVPKVERYMWPDRTVDQAAAMVRQALARKSQAPQVIVHVVDSVTNSAIVYGNVTRPGRVLLTRARASHGCRRLGARQPHPRGLRYPIDPGHTRSACGNERSGERPVAEHHHSSRRPDRGHLQTPNLYRFRSHRQGIGGPFTVPRTLIVEAIARTGRSIGPAIRSQWYLPSALRGQRRRPAAGPSCGEGKPVTPIVYQIDMMNPAIIFWASILS